MYYKLKSTALDALGVVAFALCIDNISENERAENAKFITLYSHWKQPNLGFASHGILSEMNRIETQ